MSSEGIEVAFSWEIVMSLWEYSDRLAQFCSSFFRFLYGYVLCLYMSRMGQAKYFSFHTRP